MRISDWSSDVCSSDLKCRDQSCSSGLSFARTSANMSAATPLITTAADATTPFGGGNPDATGRLPLAVAAARRLTAGWRSLAPSDRSTSTCRSEEHTSELQSLLRNSYDVFCLKKK